MQLDQNPVFRRIIVPWYDSQMACWITILGMVIVFVFAVIGVSVAQGSAAYRQHLWVPLLLLLLSGGVIFLTLVRLIRRHPRKSSL